MIFGRTAIKVLVTARAHPGLEGIDGEAVCVASVRPANSADEPDGLSAKERW